ncbi:Crp/Fnr family transcriptional regulator [Brevundimonas sp.]|uniref:Crp/Fnr family transcriptional regulator n=1 Tax=Brevundimonas sp. TaxID=1871086 RepID=UPI00391B43B0
MSWAREQFGRPAREAPTPEPRIVPTAVEQGRHPVLASLPLEVRLAVYRRGHLQEVRAGERLSEGCGVQFVLTGAVGLFRRDGSGVCLRLAGPGSIVNAEALADGGARRDRRVLVPGAVLSLRGPDLVEIIGRARADRLLIDQMLAEQSLQDGDIACNALHLAPARLARWLLQLHEAATGADIQITQAELAAMLGIQRTSVNAAGKALQDQGAVRFVRGRVRILRPEILQRSACACLAPAGPEASPASRVAGAA